MSYLLDTNTVSFALRGEGQVHERLRRVKPSQVAVSAITVVELRYGAAKRKSPKLTSAIDAVFGHMTVLTFDESAASRAGDLKRQMELAGQGIGAMDVLIAAHALASQRILVTNNTREFASVPGLVIEDWR